MRPISFVYWCIYKYFCFKFSRFILTHVKQKSGMSERSSNSNRKRAKSLKDPRAPTPRDIIHSLDWSHFLNGVQGAAGFAFGSLWRCGNLNGQLLFCNNWGQTWLQNCAEQAVQWGKQIHDTRKWLNNHHAAFIHQQIFPKDLRNWH